MSRQMDGWMNTVDRQMDGCLDRYSRWMNGWTDGYPDKYTVEIDGCIDTAAGWMYQQILWMDGYCNQMDEKYCRWMNG